MANKRLSELLPLTAGDVEARDLLYIVDCSSTLSKKIEAGELKTYLGDNVDSASYAKSASWSETSSYIHPRNVGLIASASWSETASYAFTASWAFNTLVTTYVSGETVLGTVPSSSVSRTSSYVLPLFAGIDNGTVYRAITASKADNAATASYLQYYGINNGSASYAISSSRSENVATASYINYVAGILSNVSESKRSILADTASFLKYTGANNGTSSYSMTAKTSSYNQSASFLNYTGVYNGSASYGVIALTSSYSTNAYYSSYANIATTATTAAVATSCTNADTASLAKTSSLAITSSYNVTSSYCYTASYAFYPSNANVYNTFGPFLGLAKTTTEIQLKTDTHIYTPSANTPVIVTAYGTVNVPFTSTAAGGFITLKAIDLSNPSSTTEFDRGYFENVFSGFPLGATSKMKFALSGLSNMVSSSYLVSVVAAGGLTFDTTLDYKFQFTTKADNVWVVDTTS